MRTRNVKQAATDAELVRALRGWTVAGLPDGLDALLLQAAERIESRAAPPYGVDQNPDCEGCVYTQSGMGRYPCWGDPGEPGSGCRQMTCSRDDYYTCRRSPGEETEHGYD